MSNSKTMAAKLTTKTITTVVYVINSERVGQTTLRISATTCRKNSMIRAIKPFFSCGERPRSGVAVDPRVSVTNLTHFDHGPLGRAGLRT